MTFTADRVEKLGRIIGLKSEESHTRKNRRNVLNLENRNNGIRRIVQSENRRITRGCTRASENRKNRMSEFTLYYSVIEPQLEDRNNLIIGRIV